MEKLTAFVSEHIGDDTTRLIMNRAKWPEIDMDMAVNCIESRRKLKGKVQEWCDEPALVFPRKLSAEQCSSSATGIYKAELAAKIAGLDLLRHGREHILRAVQEGIAISFRYGIEVMQGMGLEVKTGCINVCPNDINTICKLFASDNGKHNTAELVYSVNLVTLFECVKGFEGLKSTFLRKAYSFTDRLSFRLALC